MLRAHPSGSYRFLPGISAFSSGVVATPGWEIVHATLGTPVPWRDETRACGPFGEKVRLSQAPELPKRTLISTTSVSSKPASVAAVATELNPGCAATEFLASAGVCPLRGGLPGFLWVRFQPDPEPD